MLHRLHRHDQESNNHDQSQGHRHDHYQCQTHRHDLVRLSKHIGMMEIGSQTHWHNQEANKHDRESSTST